jgi:hypothetical protein
MLPERLRPLAVGALLTGCLATLTLAFSVLNRPWPGVGWWTVFAVLGAALAAGAAGGTAYLLTLPLPIHSWRVAPYVTGLACAGACLGVFAILVHLASGAPIFQRPERWVAYVVLTLILGLSLGHSWFRRDDNRPF